MIKVEELFFAVVFIHKRYTLKNLLAKYVWDLF